MDQGIIEILQTAYALYGAGGVIAVALAWLIWRRLPDTVKTPVKGLLRKAAGKLNSGLAGPAGK
jgi:hypothetical protein